MSRYHTSYPDRNLLYISTQVLCGLPKALTNPPLELELLLIVRAPVLENASSSKSFQSAMVKKRFSFRGFGETPIHNVFINWALSPQNYEGLAKYKRSILV